MPTQKQKDVVHVKQYVTDAKGHKMAAILDIKELARVHELLEDLADLKAIEERVCEKEESYEAYSRKRKSSLCV
ncbi:MAG: hypothetical protein HZC16_00270 [Candidatus Omnitrophica bacterium]|nr:hypothetical protein [Candidatus Omnitrophota bacterium]